MKPEIGHEANSSKPYKLSITYIITVIDKVVGELSPVAVFSSPLPPLLKLNVELLRGFYTITYKLSKIRRSNVLFPKTELFWGGAIHCSQEVFN